MKFPIIAFPPFAAIEAERNSSRKLDFLKIKSIQIKRPHNDTVMNCQSKTLFTHVLSLLNKIHIRKIHNCIFNK